MAKKTVSSDIYNVAGLVDDIKKAFLPNESEDTLSIGTYGYFGAVQSKRLQTQVRMTGEIGNEVFPSRARLERNVITHAIMANIEDINAIPAKMTAFLTIKEKDVSDLFDNNNTFVIDREIPIYLGDYEFHLEYDVILQRIYLQGNRYAYTAQYDITRENPSSDITSPYLSTPAVVLVDNESYIYLNVIVSQVEHHSEYVKMVTSNVIDNKTVNFEFENQLAYFEVHVTESDQDYYLTPAFEGSAIPDGVIYYCWYQYIDTNLIRVRFDRNSYMPGLNAEIEILFKTTQGKAGNFPYTENVYVDLTSSIYGYRGLTGLFIPVSDSEGGKDRKSKKELQSLIPKELLARGSITTLSDLNNYFGMFDSEYGRILAQIKIDNQQERTWYAYAVLKDDNLDVIPTNTIDLNIDKQYLIESKLNDSQYPRYILKSGQCIRVDSSGVGYISDAPIQNLGLSYQMESLTRGKLVTIVFKVEVDDDSYATMSAYTSINGNNTAVLGMPNSTNNITAMETNPSKLPIVEDYMQLSVGNTYVFEVEYVSTKDNSTIVITNDLPDYYTYNGSAYIYEGESNVPSKITSSDERDLSFSINNENTGTKYRLQIEMEVDVEANNITSNIANTIFKINESSDEGDPSTSQIEFKPYVPTMTQDKNPDMLVNGDIITYTLKYLSSSNSDTPLVKVNLSRGLSYVPFSSTITYQDGPSYTTVEPTEEDVTEEAGFIYINPYAVAINQYHLYSAFYMMSTTENPYLHFIYINQKTAVQFIATNLTWNRPFLGYDKDTYNISVTITQSVQEDMGLFPNEDNDNAQLVKCIVVFYRDGEAYRYRTLNLTMVSEEDYSFTFSKSFIANDLLDNDNNIRVEDVAVPSQMETDTTVNEYGYFNPNTEVRIYILTALPDNDGAYTRYDLDSIVPGLASDEDGRSWNVTNVYEVVNGVNFYRNYSEIMGSRVVPYGTTNDEGIMTDIQGFTIKGLPVFGYDYCQNEILVQNAIDTLNDRKAYIDSTLELLENSIGIDFKFFNTYGPSKTYYIIRDQDDNNILDDSKEYIDRIDLSFYFRVKLVVSNDSYTRNNIINDIKEYIEDLEDIGDLHIPNLVTQITNTYSESITYFEYLGFNNYGPDIQHIYRDPTNETNIHIAPEFLNIRNITNIDGTLTPDINVYVSEL